MVSHILEYHPIFTKLPVFCNKNYRRKLSVSVFIQLVFVRFVYCNYHYTNTQWCVVRSKVLRIVDERAYVIWSVFTGFVSFKRHFVSFSGPKGALRLALPFSSQSLDLQKLFAIRLQTSTFFPVKAISFPYRTFTNKSY